MARNPAHFTHASRSFTKTSRIGTFGCVPLRERKSCTCKCCFRLSTVGRRAFSVAGVRIRNDLPSDVIQYCSCRRCVHLSIDYKWHAVAAQTARCRSKVLSIETVHLFFMAYYQTQWNGRQIIRIKVGKLDHRPVAKDTGYRYSVKVKASICIAHNMNTHLYCALVTELSRLVPSGAPELWSA